MEKAKVAEIYFYLGAATSFCPAGRKVESGWFPEVPFPQGLAVLTKSNNFMSLQMLVWWDSLTSVCLSVIYLVPDMCMLSNFIHVNTDFCTGSKGQVDPAGILYKPAADFCVWGFNGD